MDDENLFAAAGLELEPVPTKPKRQRRAKAPTPAERAAAGRREGARRGRCPCALESRVRTVPVRDLAPRRVFPFPFSHNAAILQATAAKLRNGNERELQQTASREFNNVEKRLIRKGFPKQSARECARELLREAWRLRFWEMA